MRRDLRGPRGVAGRPVILERAPEACHGALVIACPRQGLGLAKDQRRLLPVHLFSLERGESAAEVPEGIHLGIRRERLLSRGKRVAHELLRPEQCPRLLVVLGQLRRVRQRIGSVALLEHRCHPRVHPHPVAQRDLCEERLPHQGVAEDDPARAARLLHQYPRPHGLRQRDGCFLHIEPDCVRSQAKPVGAQLHSHDRGQAQRPAARLRQPVQPPPDRLSHPLGQPEAGLGERRLILLHELLHDMGHEQWVPLGRGENPSGELRRHAVPPVSPGSSPPHRRPRAP